MLGTLRARNLMWPSLAVLCGLAITCSLGTWQLQRRIWKEELIATIEARAAVTPAPPEAWPRLSCRPSQEVGLELSCDFMAVRLRGTFDHARERHVFISVPRQPSGIGGPGYWVFTPLRMTFPDGAREVLVNRGFVAEALKEPAARMAGQLAGEIEIIGLLRSAEARGRFSGANDSARNVWYVRDPRELLGTSAGDARPGSATGAGSGPSPLLFYVDQTSPPSVRPGPEPVPGALALTNRHLEYALTWFGLAATLLCVYAAFLRTRWKE